MKFFNNSKQKAKPVFNIRHPDIAPYIEEVFKSGNRVYYRFKEEKLIPTGRYKYVYAHLKEVDMRMNLETLKSYVKDFKDLLNGSGAKKTIEIGALWKLILNLESRVALAFEPATVERLASVIYFDESEDLSTWNKKYSQEKIEWWRKHETLDFFLTKPIGELLGLSGISITSLVDYITEATAIIQELTLDQQMLSSESLSENGKQP
jgi:hypothetical protein